MTLPDSARSALLDGAQALGVPLDEAQCTALEHYVELLLKWNAKVNLTAVTEPHAIVDKHLLDCLAVVPAVTGTRILDVGTGPGLPSVVLAIARPALVITAVESIQKKAIFVRTVSRELKLNLEIEILRLEAKKLDPIFDTTISRATFEPSEWAERGAGFVKPGGRLIAMLSEKQSLPAAPAHFTGPKVTDHKIGGAARRIATYDRMP